MIDRDGRIPTSARNRRNTLPWETTCGVLLAYALLVYFCYKFNILGPFELGSDGTADAFVPMNLNVRSRRTFHGDSRSIQQNSDFYASDYSIRGIFGGINDNNNDGNIGNGGGGGGGSRRNDNGSNNNDDEKKDDAIVSYLPFYNSQRYDTSIQLVRGGLLSALLENGHSVPSAKQSMTRMYAHHAYLSDMAQKGITTITNKVSSKAARGTSWYLKQLESQPLITKCITGGLIGFCGDYGAQWFDYCLQCRRKKESDVLPSLNSQKQSTGVHSDDLLEAPLSEVAGALAIAPPSFKYDLRRSLSVLANGMFVCGPILHYGYNLFEAVLPLSQMPKGMRTLSSMVHVLADALILDSFFVASSMISTGVLEGRHFSEEIMPQFRSEYASTLRSAWATSAVIFPYTTLCFRVLPVSFRTMAVNFADVAWDGVVSYKNHESRNVHA